MLAILIGNADDQSLTLLLALASQVPSPLEAC